MANGPSLFDTLKAQPADPLLSLIGQFREDPRAEKIDLGVGVYRDANGVTPVMACVKEAERKLLASQTSKSYLGPLGDVAFVDLLKPLVCGDAIARDPRLTGIQTPGGTGALRLGAEVIAAARPKATLWLGLPAWPIHEPIFSGAGLTIETYRCFDVPTQKLLFDETLSALAGAQPGDVVLLHACCHNPTGADFDTTQWTALAKLMAERRLLPFLDFAYQGLGRGFEPDAAGVGIVLAHVGEALIAYSCDKNFGLYRERTGALFAYARDAATAQRISSNMRAAAGAMWAMPPDHGAAVVRLVLESESLKADWRRELSEMQNRIVSVRQELAATDDLLSPLARQRGMFSLLPLDAATIARLRTEHGIYMVGSGRINVLGFQAGGAQRFARALRDVRA